MTDAEGFGCQLFKYLWVKKWDGGDNSVVVTNEIVVDILVADAGSTSATIHSRLEELGQSRTSWNAVEDNFWPSLPDFEPVN